MARLEKDKGREKTEKAPAQPNGAAGQDSSSCPAKDESDDDHTTAATSTRWRPQDVIFAFGPDNEYFISDSLTSWRFWGRVQLAQSFKKLEQSQPIAVALTPDHGAIMVYEDDDGIIRVNRSTAVKDISSEEARAWSKRHDRYEALAEFIIDREGTATTDVYLSIGSNGSWFARSGDKIAHDALPGGLLKEMQAKKEDGIEPVQVTLGYHGDWIALWSKNASPSWTVSSDNGVLKYLKSGEDINTVVLSPYDSGAFFLVTQRGEVLHALSGQPSSELRDICDRTRAFMQRTARTFDRSLEWDATTDGLREHYTITPHTAYDKPQPTGLANKIRQINVPGGWQLDRVERMLRERQNLSAIGAATMTSAVVVGTIGWYLRDSLPPPDLARSSAIPTWRLLRLPWRSAAIAGVLAGAGTSIICTWTTK